MTSPVPEANEAAEVVHRERAADRAVERFMQARESARRETSWRIWLERKNR